MNVRQSSRKAANAREQIDLAAYELFSQYGVGAVGVDRLAAHAGVAKRTLYKYYPSKNELVIAFLRRREELWTRSWLQGSIERAAATPAQKLLAIFDVFDNWFHRPDFEACSFIRVLLEHAERRHPLRKASQRHIDTLRLLIRGLAVEAQVPDHEEFARQWQILMMGSIIAAYAGDLDAARRTRAMGALLLARNGIDARPGARK